MLTDPKLRSQVDALWDKLWTGGLTNPLDAIEQLSFLLFLKRLDEAEQDRERDIRLHRTKRAPIFPDPKLRWSYWINLKADEALKHVKEKVFPFIKTLGGSGGSFAEQMANAEFKINKPSLLIEACKAIDAMQISAQNQDVPGRSLRILARQAQHRWDERTIPHTAPHHSHDGEDARSETTRAHV